MHQVAHFHLQQTFSGSMLTCLLPKSASAPAVCPVCSAGDSPVPWCASL